MPNVCARARRLRFSGTAPRGVALLARLAAARAGGAARRGPRPGDRVAAGRPGALDASERPAAPPSAAPPPAAPAPAAATGQPPAPSSPPASAQPATPAPPAASSETAAAPPTASGQPARALGRLAGPACIASAASPAPADAPSSPGIGSLQLPRDLSPWSMFMSADMLVQGRHDRPGVRLGRDVDGVARQEHRAVGGASRRLRAALAAISTRAVPGRRPCPRRAAARHPADADRCGHARAAALLRPHRQEPASRSASPRGSRAWRSRPAAT